MTARTSARQCTPLMNACMRTRQASTKNIPTSRDKDHFISSQKLIALAAATLSESTPRCIGIITR